MLKTRDLTATARRDGRACVMQERQALLTTCFYFSKRSKTKMPTFFGKLLLWSETFA